MYSCPIPLSSALPNSPYIVHGIDDSKLSTKAFCGYGIYPGNKIKLLFASPSGNPHAYEVMGAVLALRKEDAGKILVTPYQQD